MNIFEILASGDNGLNEVHVSSVLGWLLDPYHDHGLGIEVLKRLVSKLFEGTPLDKEIISSEYSGVELKRRRRIEISIMLEKEVFCEQTGKGRSIDIVIKINNKFILAIENKIRVSSKEHGQVMDEIRGLLDEPKNNNPDGLITSDIKEFYFIYLVKQDNELEYATKELENQLQAVFTKPISWINNNKNELSMSKILQDILIDHAQGRINPVPAETIFLLKSFIRFAENGFSYYQWSYVQNDEQFLFDDLKNKDKSYYVGYQGGVKALKSKLLEAKTNPSVREYLLSKRQYKFTRNQLNSNWIQLKELLDIFKENGF
jgi:hypothetical protein